MSLKVLRSFPKEEGIQLRCSGVLGIREIKELQHMPVRNIEVYLGTQVHIQQEKGQFQERDVF